LLCRDANDHTSECAAEQQMSNRDRKQPECRDRHDDVTDDRDQPAKDTRVAGPGPSADHVVDLGRGGSGRDDRGDHKHHATDDGEQPLVQRAVDVPEGSCHHEADDGKRRCASRNPKSWADNTRHIRDVDMVTGSMEEGFHHLPLPT
jgi:hypothetical protein